MGYYSVIILSPKDHTRHDYIPQTVYFVNRSPRLKPGGFPQTVADPGSCFIGSWLP